jgi:hypothetical protein
MNEQETKQGAGVLIVKQQPENVAIHLSDEELRTILVYLKAVRDPQEAETPVINLRDRSILAMTPEERAEDDKTRRS